MSLTPNDATPLNQAADKWKSGAESAELCPNKRLRILNRAAQAFLTHGFEGANLEDIANSAGVSKATIYRYFADKKDLFESFVVETTREMSLPLRESLNTQGSMEEALTSYAECFITRMLRPVVDGHPFYEVSRLLIGASQRHPGMVKSCRDVFARDLAQPVLEFISQKIEEGEIIGEDSTFLMTHFVQMLFFTNAVLIDPEREPMPGDIRPFAERTVKLFLNGCQVIRHDTDGRA